MREAMHITLEKTFPSGAYRCTTLYRNQYFERCYFFYTKRDVLREFRTYVKHELGIR